MKLLFRVIPSSVLSLLWKTEVKSDENHYFDGKNDCFFFSRSERVLSSAKSCCHCQPVAQMAVAFRVMTGPPSSCFLTRGAVESFNRKVSRMELELMKKNSFVEMRREDDVCFPQGPLGKVGVMGAVSPACALCLNGSSNYKPAPENAGSALNNRSVEEECGDSKRDKKSEEVSLFPPSELAKLAVECVGSSSSPRWIPFLLSRLAAAAALDHPKFYQAAGLPQKVLTKWDGTVFQRTNESAAHSSQGEENALRWWPASRSEVRRKSKGQTALSLTHEDWVGAAVAWNTMSPDRMKSKGEKGKNVASPVKFAVDVVDVAAIQRLHRKYPAKFRSRMLPQCWLSPPSSPMEREGKEKEEICWRVWLQKTAMSADFPFSPLTPSNLSCSSNSEKEIDSEIAAEQNRRTSLCVSSFLALHANYDVRTAVGAIALSQHWSLRECIIKLIGIPQRSFPYDQVKTSDVFTSPPFLPFSSSLAPHALPLPRGILQPFQVYHTSVPFDSSLAPVYCCSSSRSSSPPSSSSFAASATHSIPGSPRVSVKCMSWLEWYAVPLQKMPPTHHTSLSSSYSLPPSPFSPPIAFSGNKEKLLKNINTWASSYQPPSLVSTARKSEKEMSQMVRKCLTGLPEELQWEWRPHVITVAMSLK